MGLSSVIYITHWEIFLPYRIRLQVTKATISSPLASFSSMSFLADLWYTYKETPHQNKTTDLTGQSRHWTKTHTYFLAADSIAQTSTKHLLAALRLQPLHTHRIHHSVISYTVAMWLRLGLLRLRLVQCCLYICEAGRARSCSRTWERSETSHAELKNRMLQLNAETNSYTLHQIEDITLDLPRHILIIPFGKLQN